MELYKKYLLREGFNEPSSHFTEEEKTILNKVFAKKYYAHAGIPFDYSITLDKEEWGYRQFDVSIIKKADGSFKISSSLDREFPFGFKPRVSGSGKKLDAVIKKVEAGIKKVEADWKGKWKKEQDKQDAIFLKQFGAKKAGDYYDNVKRDWERKLKRR